MKILNCLHKIHSLLFYKLVRFVLRLDKMFINMPDMEWVMYKAFFALFCIQAIWILILWKILEIILKKAIPDFFEDQLISNLLLLGGLSIFNYFTLIYKKNGLNTITNLQVIPRQEIR